jgi:ubiquinone/menaquinone biosynthesis C-methylase UbiE
MFYRIIEENIMTDMVSDKEAQKKSMIQKTFQTVAEGYGQGGARFFHDCGNTMANLHLLKGSENILDVACGTGAAAIPLARRLPNGQVTAVDFSTAMLDQARRHAQSHKLDNIRFEIHDMTQMPFEQQFDHANCAFGLFFVEDMVSLLNHIASKVKPGGHVMVSGFTGQSFMPYAELIFNRLEKYGVELPASRFGWKAMSEPEQLYSIFGDAGLGDIEITRESMGYYTDVQGWWEVIWFAGFRGLVNQLGDRLEQFKQEHFEEVNEHLDDQGLWLEIDVNFTRGIVK